MKKLIIATVIITSTLAACKTAQKSAEIKKPTPLDCSTQTFSYAMDIKPVLEKNCTRCHNENEKAGYNFLKIEFVKKAATSGHLLGSIKHGEGYNPMPKFAGKLDQSTIDKIECWINNGMKE